MAGCRGHSICCSLSPGNELREGQLRLGWLAACPLLCLQNFARWCAMPAYVQLPTPSEQNSSCYLVQTLLVTLRLTRLKHPGDQRSEHTQHPLQVSFLFLLLTHYRPSQLWAFHRDSVHFPATDGVMHLPMAQGLNGPAQCANSRQTKSSKVSGAQNLLCSQKVQRSYKRPPGRVHKCIILPRPK